MKTKITLLLATALSLFAFTGCNTVDGLGQDIENAGDSIQDSTN